LAESPKQVDARKVFVIHGRNEPARRGLFDFLRALGLEPIEWSQAIAMTGQGSPYIGDVLDAVSRRHRRWSCCRPRTTSPTCTSR
jgi:predicted nucleotide-binding protein